MCGIVGFAGRVPIEQGTLVEMADSLRHRGPDDSGCWMSEDGMVGFAHRRLSIIDLSALGHQPMSDGAAEVHVSYNGEIYNFMELREELERDGVQFRSRSDTEVLIYAYLQWGESFVERLNGMFAIAMYDTRSGVMLLARDRAGEKPLFCWRTADRVVFASELKALFAFRDFPRRLNPIAIEQYFAYGYVSRELCMLDGVQKILPGHIVTLRPATGEWRDREYWRLPETNATHDVDEEELERELEELLEDAVRKQLVADVPVAVLLSGGVDSSVITAMASRARSRVRTFTVSFPSHSGYDEAPYARIVASHFGTEHIEVVAESDASEYLPLLVKQFDEPIADSSMIPTYMVSQLIREHATVAIGGDGGDELFGGYPQYSLVQRIENARRFTPRFIRKGVSAVARRMPLGSRGRNYLVGFEDHAGESISRMNLYFDSERRQRVLLNANGSESPEQRRFALGEGARSTLQAAQRADFRSYLVDDILVKVDRASMLASLETRAPYLDRRVIEFVFGRVPDHLKATTRERKILLRRLASRILPRELELRRKQGFSIPLGAWLRKEWQPLMRDVFAGADLRLFRPEGLAEMVRNHERGIPNEHRIYALMFFELWRREWGVTL